MAQLKKEQQDEYDKHERCNKDIDTTEDNIKEATNEKDDLDEKHQQLVNIIDTLDTEMERLKAEVASTEISLKKAGEDRHAQNELFKSSVTDQRATVEILNKALARLKQ